MSRIRVSMGVLPARRTKKSCSITDADTVRSEGSRSKSLPNLVGWAGYWVLQYSSSAHCDFSCSCSMWFGSVRPQASKTKLFYTKIQKVLYQLKRFSPSEIKSEYKFNLTFTKSYESFQIMKYLMYLIVNVKLIYVNLFISNKRQAYFL